VITRQGPRLSRNRDTGSFPGSFATETAMRRIAIVLLLAVLSTATRVEAGSFTVRNCYPNSTIDVHAFNENDPVRLVAYKVVVGISYKQERQLDCRTDHCRATIHLHEQPSQSSTSNTMFGDGNYFGSAISFGHLLTDTRWCFDEVDAKTVRLSRECIC